MASAVARGGGGGGVGDDDQASAVNLTELLRHKGFEARENGLVVRLCHRPVAQETPAVDVAVLRACEGRSPDATSDPTERRLFREKPRRGRRCRRLN